MSKTFKDLGLSPEILKAIEEKGFKTPSAIQAGVIPLLLNGEKDIIGQAQTGTGKTAAFALPLLERINASEKRTQAIVLTPTRELAIQIVKEIQSFSVPNSPKVEVVYGGNPMRHEINALRRNPQIIVGTPGRVQHHIRTGVLRLDDIKYFVLDEADEMLNFGFREEIEKILELTPPQRRVLLFSATMPKSILAIVNKYMGDYDSVKIDAKDMTNTNITQKYYCIAPQDKFEALCQIMEAEETFYAIVFCRTKNNTDVIANKLAAKHLSAEAIHGDIDQSQREKTLKKFREGKIKILVATDVAARGIDVESLNFVVNYSIPENEEIYTHRIGRTGRAGNTGTAITLITASERNRLNQFERKLNVKIQKGVLPSPKELIEKKKQHLIERIESIIDNNHIEYLEPIAKELLEEADATKVVAALLKDAYQNDLDEKTYKAIPEDTFQAASHKRRRNKGRYGGGRGFGGYKGGQGKGGYRGGKGGGRGYGGKKKFGGGGYGKKRSGGGKKKFYNKSK